MERVLRKSQYVQVGKRCAVSSSFALMGFQIQGKGNTGKTQRLWMKVIGKDEEQTGKHKKIWDTGRRKNSMRRLRRGLCSIIRFSIKRFHAIKQNPLQPKLLFWTPRSICVPLMKELKHQPVSFSWLTWAYVLFSFFMLPMELDLLSWGNSWSHCRYWGCFPGRTPAFPQQLWPGSVTLATALCPLPLPSFSVMALPLI